MKPNVATALTIAGSDSSGGAGIQADLKTFAAHGVYGASVITALTAQNTTGVQGVHAVPAQFVAEQMASVFSDLDVRAAKTGMLATAEIIAAVADRFADQIGLITVVDPVMIATSGDPLISPDAVGAMRDLLVPRASLVTPNLHEAAALTDTSVAADDGAMMRQAETLLRLGCGHVLVKGGHGGGPDARDLLLGPHGPRWLTAPRVDTSNTHGTGCTLSAAIVANVVRGLAVADAVAAAKAYLTRALESGRTMRVGRGSGPVDHLVDRRGDHLGEWGHSGRDC